MLRDIIYKGKELADKVTNIMMNYTEAELKVREATNDDMCCPSGRLLQKLADYTYTYESCFEVMSTLWKRMHFEDRFSWRRSLVVLTFLLKNGSDYVLQSAQDHIYDIRTLESFRYFDENGKDQGMNVRIRVQEVIDLIQDSEKLQQERQKAKASRHIYTGYGNTNDLDRGYSSYKNNGDYGQRSDSLDDYNKETYVPKNFTFQSSAKSRVTISEHKSDQPPPRLGSFDDWHVGKERGVMDDVLEQFKEAWDLAKESTKDLIFSKNPQDNRSNEFNPRMVSEEVYEFPSNAVESGGTYEAKTQSSYGDYSAQNEFSSKNHFRSTKCNSVDSRVNNNNNGDTHASQSNGKSLGQVIVTPRNQSTEKKDNIKPRPPSCDLLDSFNSGNSITKSDQMIDLFDAICDSPTSTTTGVHSQRQQPAQMEFKVNWPKDVLTPSGVSLNTNSVQNHAITLCQNPDNLLDNEFGDFTSASSVQFPVNTGSTISSLDGIFFSNFSNTEACPSNQNSHQNKQTEEFKQQQQHVVQSNPTSPSKSKPINIGNTWKELGSLSIDLDSLAKPEKYGARTQAPSLHQLKQNQQRVQ
ncbi:epsin 4/enthoprotin, putative [Schistosoma mansoni]|uniref:epsin 4/enthoprotin, putative n=1 Tax=Schistosoma mansoni TaxID=6183 RepID=UPI00022C81EF|nr:epsin 4/enthoprotin, putative [Schistosoma mansoni]|eukprot:XP_018645212.1 epsin 4/enthoprotin, putative [Schistosoma mansoni]